MPSQERKTKGDNKGVYSLEIIELEGVLGSATTTVCLQASDSEVQIRWSGVTMAKSDCLYFVCMG